MQHLLESFRLYLTGQGNKKLGIVKTVSCVKHFLSYLEVHQITLEQLTYKQAQDYKEYLMLSTATKEKLPFSAGTVNGYLRGIRRFFEYLLASGAVYMNPFAHVTNVKRNRPLPRNVLSIADTGRLLEAARSIYKFDDSFLCALYLLYGSGARIGEIYSLTGEDVATDEGYIRILDDKTRRDRICLLPEASIVAARCYMQQNRIGKEDPLFPWRSRNSFTAYMNLQLKHVCEAAKIARIHCHSIRHTLGTQLLQRGADIRVVQEMLGHRDIGSTQVYTHLCRDEVRHAIERFHPRAT